MHQEAVQHASRRIWDRIMTQVYKIVVSFGTNKHNFEHKVQIVLKQTTTTCNKKL
jgi:hypothetical protein